MPMRMGKVKPTSTARSKIIDGSMEWDILCAVGNLGKEATTQSVLKAVQEKRGFWKSFGARITLAMLLTSSKRINRLPDGRLVLASLDWL